MANPTAARARSSVVLWAAGSGMIQFSASPSELAVPLVWDAAPADGESAHAAPPMATKMQPIAIAHARPGEVRCGRATGPWFMVFIARFPF